MKPRSPVRHARRPRTWKPAYQPGGPGPISPDLCLTCYGTTRCRCGDKRFTVQQLVQLMRTVGLDQATELLERRLVAFVQELVALHKEQHP